MDYQPRWSFTQSENLEILEMDFNIMRLFTYRIPIDDGAAPNPFWGVCTLAICKPRIRSTAKKGDWVAGIGATRVEGNTEYSKKLVYAMKITEDPMPLDQYNGWCKEHLPEKIPDISLMDWRMHLGDCIYHDFDLGGNPQQRKGVHTEGNILRDIGGKNALVSKHFYYFGDRPIDIPDHLSGMVIQQQCHFSNKNDKYAVAFVNWIDALGLLPNELYGHPQIKLDLRKDINCRINSCGIREKDDSDEVLTAKC